MPIANETLARAGIRLSPEDFDALVQGVVEELARARDTSAAEDGLPESEAAALQRAGLTREASSPRSLADPVAGLAAAYAALLATSLSVSEAARRLGVDPSRVRQRLQERTLVGFKQRGEWRLPEFQFEAGGTVPGFGGVASRLPPDLHPVAVKQWFVSPCPDLGIDEQPISPRDWLRAGGSAEVVAAIAAELA